MELLKFHLDIQIAKAFWRAPIDVITKCHVFFLLPHSDKSPSRKVGMKR